MRFGLMLINVSGSHGNPLLHEEHKGAHTDTDTDTDTQRHRQKLQLSFLSDWKRPN